MCVSSSRMPVSLVSYTIANSQEKDHRRAEQNIYDPTNADSDDDERHGSDTDEEERNCVGMRLKKDSCTSFEFQERETSDVKVDIRKSWATHDFIFGQSDVGYFSFPKSKADFLPTGSMIEEVFGVDSWNFSEPDSNGSSLY
ncbi:hypothetical protein Tco_1416175 [Tanacetum coccineum]